MIRGRGGKWEQRLRRADELAVTHPFAAEGLRFYSGVAACQQSFYGALAAESGGPKRVRAPGSLRQELDLFPLVTTFSPFLTFLGEIAPPPLAQAAASLRAAGEERWAILLEGLWRLDDEAAEDVEAPTAAEALLVWTHLQPYAEHLADHTEPLEVHGTPSVCPLCASLPQVGVLRPQGDGGKRSLICSLCAHEWDFRRIVCAACGEESVEKLPVYVAEELPHVRVEACDTCHSYIKTIDLTKDGRAVPVVDELAAIPLSLWAAEKGYVKVSGNLLGI
jgi:FdhE protein